MAVFNFIYSLAPRTLAIINDTASSLAVVNTNKNTSSSLNYIIGGLIVIIIVLVGTTLFGKK